MLRFKFDDNRKVLTKQITKFKKLFLNKFDYVYYKKPFLDVQSFKSNLMIEFISSFYLTNLYKITLNKYILKFI
jgi:hypothetical protein